MSIYAISDLHLSFSTNKPMDTFGIMWKNHEEKIKKNWIETVKDDDFVILPGDISWAMTLNEAKLDFEYIDKLPGKKIIMRGNHDYYYSTKTKMDKFFKENNFTTLNWLQGGTYVVEDKIICGTRGWGKTEGSDAALDEKIIVRETLRLKSTLEKAKAIQDEILEEKGEKYKIILAMHFPPFIDSFKEVISCFDIDKCIYGHLHGYGHMLVKEGVIDNVEYIMVGCDYNNFILKKLY